MKVLLIAGEFPPMEGGVGDYTRLLGDALTAAGSADAPIDVHVLTSVRATPDPPAPVDAIGVTRHTRLESWGFVPLYGAVDQLLRELAPDVVHIQYQSACYGLHPAINLLPLRLRRRGVPCVTTFHDLLTPYLFPKAGPLRWRSVHEMARASTAVIVTNVADELRLLQEGGVSRLVRIPIGSNVPRVLPAGYDRAAWRRRWGAPEDALVLAYFGFLNASKGGDELVAALDLVVRADVNAYLLLVGGAVGASDPTNRAYGERVQRAVAERGLQQRVMSTGYLAPQEVSASLCCADLCVLPYRDGASFRRGSLLAALEHGLAIVSTTPPVAVPELRDDENIVLTPPGDAGALAEAIVRLAADPLLRTRLGVAARELSRAFGWDAIAAQTVEVYRAVTR